jgi:acetyltransferase-like isoleucine patch superfamily enzyme
MRADPKFGYLARHEVEAYGFASVGEDVLIHSLANIVGAGNLCIGSNARIDGFMNLIAQAPVTLGDHVHIGSFCHISASSEVRIGDFCSLSQGVCLYTASDDYSGEAFTHATLQSSSPARAAGPISVRDYVILGPKVVVLPGVTIGEGAAVGALSLVKGDLEEWGVYGGVPVRRIKARSQALRVAADRHRKPK